MFTDTIARRCRLGAGVLALLLAAAAPAAAEEFYYVLIFGSQSQPKQLRLTHTWATFVRAVGQGQDPSSSQLYQHTISWYPASMKVRVWTPFPEEGVNLTLEQSLAAVYANEERVVLWGPFLVSAEIYNRSVGVYNELLQGKARYRAISSFTDLYIADCIHAVAAVDDRFGRGHYPLIRVGLPASRYISRQIVLRSPRNGVFQANHDNSWLIPRLGLDRYPMEIVPPQAIPMKGCVLCVKGP